MKNAKQNFADIYFLIGMWIWYNMPEKQFSNVQGRAIKNVH